MLPDLDMLQWWSWLICIALLAVGIFFLVKFSDLFVDASSSIAKRFHISEMIIGLTIVAFGTSCPELAVSVSDSITCLLEGGNANVAIGNVVGSNICNLLLVLGFSAIFTPIIIKKTVCKKEYPILLFVTALLVIFGLCFNLNGMYAILRWEGIIFVVLILIYVVYLVLDAKRMMKEGIDVDAEEIELMPTWKSIVFVILGLAGIAVGGEAVVYGAKSIAVGVGDLAHLNHDLVESLVGLTIVAVGTSLPELVTSIVAAKKGQNDMALGNVIGSNIFNILFVLGFSGVINPLTVGNQIVFDLAVMMISTLLVFGLCFLGKINRKSGAILLGCYAGYLIYLICRTVI
ncbi:MAG: calcium/sodium antiporter [Anaeroplasmataceae bacterium]|nr:calcium/sodium antiporter [Anaeroplasmataceae bacterium]MDE6415197.1 calcium/sodium antiporter [Anaeroplasmataceae bacterium]